MAAEYQALERLETPGDESLLRQSVSASKVDGERADGEGPVSCRASISNLLEKPESSVAAQVIQMFLMLVITISTVCVIIETVPEFQENPIFLPAEMCFTALFTAEFALRLYACDSIMTFASNGFNAIDFLAIFPGYMQLIGVVLHPAVSDARSATTMEDISKAATSMRSLRMVRIIRLVRVFRVMRLAKVARHSQLLTIIFMVFLKVAQSGLLVVLMLMSFAMVLSSSLVYLFESELCEQSGQHCAGPSAFVSIPASFWWSISTLTTVGYGDMVPHSTAGKVIGAMTAVSGLVVVAIGIALVSLNFKECYIEEKAKADLARRQVPAWSELQLQDTKEIDDHLQAFEQSSSALLERLRAMAERQDKAQLTSMLDMLVSHSRCLATDVKAFKANVVALSEDQEDITQTRQTRSQT
mmetsp:Transcript_69311/g.122704  ORF Transcript_69311/g.122704 Transcript_69311/m.122704 type:complete len:414 (-) Transcript_69311:19-1260(-)